MMRSALNRIVKAHRCPSLAATTLSKRKCGLLAVVDNIWKEGTECSSAPILNDDSVLLEATSKLEHRGPDGRYMARGILQQGTKSLETTRSPPQWAMGHQRLAIVDPNSHSADMPFVLSLNGKKVRLVANGEIYNHKNLYTKLTQEHGWNEERVSHSDCEVIAHACASLGPEQAVRLLDGMFAFCYVEEASSQQEPPRMFAARDPVGIKPLYYGTTLDGNAYVVSSELKALVGHVKPDSVKAIPPGHYWTPETGLVRYYRPEWLLNDDYAPWEDDKNRQVSSEELVDAFKAAVKKRMMADVDYGFFLSGGVDSCVVAHTLLPIYRAETGDDRPIPAFTVGMEDSPDMMAARAMVDALGGPRYVDHRQRVFTADEVFDLIPRIVYHMETYEAELIRSAIPNWLLAERAGADVKMVLTGEGADELFAGYLYFMDAPTPRQVQNELRRIYGMLGDINLHRTDRMTMAHALEARVPFLDTKFTELVMSIDPALKMVDREAVAKNAPGREKTLLRQLFEGENANGHSIPKPVLWRAKAMQCEGVGEDWVSILQRRVSAQVTDAELANAANLYPLNTPHTKEELYYRRLFEEHYAGMAHVVRPWEGGCRAAGASWKSDSYTREGLANTKFLTHSFQKKSVATAAYSTLARRSFSTSFTRSVLQGKVNSRMHSTVVVEEDEFMRTATDSGYTVFESSLTLGGDDRGRINLDTGTNKYHSRPRPIDKDAIFRGSCTCNAPTELGYNAAMELYELLQEKSGRVLETTMKNVFEDQRRRIATALELPDGVEVALCPSGSDAEYFPLAFARALRPDLDKIVNITTQLKEIGAGSSPASSGKYFSTHAPLIGRLPKGLKQLQGFNEESIISVAIPARERDGTVLDASTLASEAAQQAKQDGAYPIVHGVFGGKTGLRDSEMPGSEESGDVSLGVVDACQGRFSLQELHEWLEQDSVVLFTASKFYQAPPFCGAVLIPKRIAEKLRNAPAPQPLDMLGPQGLGAFVTDKELPACLDNWKPHVRASHGGAIQNNVGLALRWQAGLAGMEALAHVPDVERVQAVKDWASAVQQMVEVYDELDAWCVERSIVSIRLRKYAGGDGWLNMSELRDAYRYMSLDVSDAVPLASKEEREVLAVCCNLGQPVDVAESHAIVRIALGAESLASFLSDKERTLHGDALVVKKLAVVAKHFSALKASAY